MVTVIVVARALASNWYITQSGAGSLNGTSVGNAWAVGSQTWGGAGIVAGDTVHLDGTFTSAFTISGSGSSGNPITILFDSGANFSVPAWAVSGAVILSGRSYVTINGDVTGGRQGLIQSTANGTGLSNQVNSVGVILTNCSNITVENLTVSPMYVRTVGTDQNNYGVCVYCLGNNGSGISSITVNNCTLTDATGGFYFVPNGACSNITYSNCTSYNCNWCGVCSGSGSSANTIVGMYVYGNRFSNWTNWDDTSGADTFHHNGFFTFATAGSTADTVYYYNNIIGPNYSLNGGGVNKSTSGLFIQFGVTNARAYNNLFLTNGSGDNPSTGFIYFNPEGNLVSTYLIANNTFVGGGTGIGINFSPDTFSVGGTQTLKDENNLFQNVDTAVAVFYSGTTSLTCTNNLGYGGLGNAFKYSTNGSAGGISIATWQSETGQDANFSTSNPLLNSANIPSSSSPCRAGGTNATLASVPLDLSNRPRPPTPSIGAYEYYQTALSALAPGRGVVVGGP